MTLLNRLKKKKHRKRAEAVIESLEPRMLFSSDIFGSVLNDSAMDDPLSELLNDVEDSFNQQQAEIEQISNINSTSEDQKQSATGDDGAEPVIVDPLEGSTAQYLLTPLAFEVNAGQVSSDVDFMARGSGYSVFLTEGDAVLSFAGEDSSHVVRLNVVGGNPINVLGGDHLTSKTNYLIGNDSADWQQAVDQYANVQYMDVYDGIDLRYYGNERQLEYDFIVAPGADASNIRLNFEGIHSLSVADNGELLLKLTAEGKQIQFKAPYSYQEIDGLRQVVESNYMIHEDGSVGFTLAQYDNSRELVIDPILDYGTFLGGLGEESASDIFIDALDNSYIVGQTSSASDYPTTVGPQGPTGNNDAFVTKLSADGSTVLWSTVIGGTKNDEAYAVAVGGSGNINIVGVTKSDDFATLNAFDTSLNGVADAFLLELNSAGDTLLYSTYFGGDGNGDVAKGAGIAVDASGYVYIGGNINKSTNFTITPGVLDSTYSGSNEGFVAKFDTSQNGAASLIYSSFIGGSGREDITGLDVDDSGNVVVTGYTNSTDFLVTPATAYASTRTGGQDVFVTKINGSGDTLLYSTYLGGSGDDKALAVTLDSTGNIFVTGFTDSVADYPTTVGAYQTSNNGAEDIIVSMINPNNSGNSSLVYSTLLGGGDSEQGTDIAVDAAGNVYLTGHTSSSDFPTTADALDSTRGGGPANVDAFVSIIAPNGNGASDLLYSSFLGGDNDADVGYGIAIDSAGNVYVTGETQASDFTTTAGAYDQVFDGTGEAFVVKFSDLLTQSMTIGLPGGALNYTEGDGTVIIDAVATVVDPDGGDFDSGTLTVDFTVNSTINDLLSIRDQGLGLGNIQVTGNAISYDYGAGAIAIGSFVAGDGITPLVITLNIDADAVAVQALMRNITYTNNSANPSTLSRTLRVVLTDGDGGTSNTELKTINLNAVNNTPTIAINTGTTVLEGSTGNTITSAMLNEGDVDDNGIGLTYTVTSVTTNGSLRLNGTALGVNDTYTQDDIDNNRLTYDHDGSETTSDSFNFSLADGGEDGALPITGSFSITVSLVNDNAPDLNDVTVALDENSSNATVVIDLDEANGTDTDADGEALSYSISAGNGSGAFAIDGATGVITVANSSALDYESINSFALTVEASDGVFSDSATVTINLNNLNDNAPDLNDVTMALDENSSNATVVIDLDEANGTDTDADGEALSYSISAGNGSGAFAIDTATGVITVANSSALDYESINSFALTVEASDGVFSDSATVTINLNNLNDNAPDLNDVTVALDENSSNATVVIDLDEANGTDTDADGEALSYSISAGNGSGAFAIDGATGVITVANSSALDYESINSFALTVEASDGVFSDSATVTINLNNLNDNALDLNDVTMALDENSSNATVVIDLDEANGTDTDADGEALSYSISAGNGSGAFAIDGATGVITVANSSALDYESINSFALTVEASDGVFSDSATVTINLNNLNDNAPDLNDVTMALDENSSNATVVIDLDEANGTDTDADGEALTYSISAGNGSGAFAIDGATGVITVANSSALDYESINSFALTVEASDGGSSDSAIVSINLNNVNDNAPVIDGATVALDEHSSNSTVVFDLEDASGMDTDADGEALNYSISAGNGSGAFAIDGATGVITVANSSALDYESINSFALTVEANDGGGSDSAIVTVNLNELNEKVPLVVGPSTNQDVDNGATNEGVENEMGSLGDLEAGNDEIVSLDDSAQEENVTVTAVSADTADILPTHKPESVADLADGIESLQPIESDALVSLVADSKHYIEPVADRAESKVFPPSKFIDLHSIDLAPFELGNQEPLAAKSMVHSNSFVAELELLNHELEQATKSEHLNHGAEVKMVTGVAMSLTAGIVSWVLKTGSLMASFLSSAPAWKQFDPLPILSNTNSKKAVPKGQQKTPEHDKGANVEELFK